MALLVRLLEKLSGKPHKHENARVVSQAAAGLREDVHAFTTMLHPYVEADDPLVALMTDVFNQRQVIQNDRPPN